MKATQTGRQQGAGRSEAPCGPQEPLNPPPGSQAPETAPEAATREVSGTHGATETEANPAPRPWTPDRRNDDGTTTITLKRACNGCDQMLGDVTDQEIQRAAAGLPAQDVRGECAHCRPLVEIEAQGCRTWQLTPRNFARVADEIDRMRPWVFTKGYWQEVDGKLQVVGLRVGQYPDHVVAFFGDWLIRHPDGRFSVHKAPEAVTA